MKRIIAIAGIVIFFLSSLFPFSLFPKVLASSDQAYSDYIYQSDIYRNNYSEFQIAKNEYLKFRTLTSQTTALEKTKIMLAQRDNMLQSYLSLLKEKLNEDTGLNGPDKNQYQSILQNEITFLTKHTSLLPSIGSLDDASKVSNELESHYLVLRTSIQQLRIALGIGAMSRLALTYDDTIQKARMLMDSNRLAFPIEKQATIDRWFLQIDNKRTLYQQKIDSIAITNGSLRKNTLAEVDSAADKLFQNIAEARQYLSEGTSYMNELLTALRYID